MTIKVPEEFWMVALMQSPIRELKKTIDDLQKDLEVRFLQLPESGLDLIQMQDSVLGQLFYLGELSVSQCEVEIMHRPSGKTQRGYSKVMIDSEDHVCLLATADALLRMDVNFHQLENILTEGYECWAAKKEQRKSILAETRVDFSLL